MNIHFENIKKLAEIQDLDSRILRLEKELAGYPERAEAVKEELENDKTALEETKTKGKAALVEKKKLENELLEADENIKKHQRELNAVKSNDAFKALLSEIENLKKLKDESETRIIELLEKVDALSAAEKTAFETFKTEEAKKNVELAEIGKKTEEVTVKISEMKSRREALAPAIEEDMLRKYDHIRKQKGGLCLVIIKMDGKSYFCGGCNISLTPDQQVNAHKKDTLVVCENCGRMMHLEETAAA